MPNSPDAFVDLIKFGLIVGSGVGAIIAVFFGFKKGSGTTKPVEATVVSATVADSNAVRELISVINKVRTEIGDARDQRHRDSMAEREAMHDLTDTIRRGGLPPNWLELVGRAK